jgi:hypothetical protein
MQTRLRRSLKRRRKNPKTLHHVSTGAYKAGQKVRTITFGKGIKARIAYPKGSRQPKTRAKRGKGKGVITTLLFDPSRYTLAEAKKWAKDHGYPVSETAAAGTTKPRKKKKTAKKKKKTKKKKTAKKKKKTTRKKATKKKKTTKKKAKKRAIKKKKKRKACKKQGCQVTPRGRKLYCSKHRS